MKQFNFLRSLFVAAFLIIGTLTLSSCSDDNDGPSGAYSGDGVFVLNEGNFTQSNGSISYYNSGTQQVQHDIFGKENNAQLLGDVIQHMTLYGDRAFIVANNSNKIEVVNAATFKSVGVVEGLSAPRFFVALSNEKGYATEWLAPKPDWSYNKGRVAVIDLKTYTVVKTVEVEVQPEQLLIANGKLYVTSQGGNAVTVINTANDAVEANIPVTYGSNSLALDRDDNLWVLSSGNKDWALPESEHTAGALTKISTSNNTVTSTITFPQVAASAGKLTLNGSKDKLHFIYDGGVHQLDIQATSLNTTPLIDRSFYGLGVDPDNGYVYGADENNFAGDGTVHIYQPDGTKVGEFKAGIGPNGFVFR